MSEKISDTYTFGAEGAARLRMNQYSELARKALELCDDPMFEEARAQMQAVAGAFPEVHYEWRNGRPVQPEVPADVLTNVTGLSIVD